MNLDATLDVLLADATPAVEAALREVARRAYETGYREALASARRAGASEPVTPPPLPPSPLPPSPAVALPPAPVEDDVEAEDAPPSAIGPLELDWDDEDEEEDAPPEEVEVDVETLGEDDVEEVEDGDGDREALLTTVERVVKGSQGVALSDIVRLTGLSPGWVGRALRALKRAKRIHQGGDRRFARYAGDAATALQASLDARGRGAARPAPEGEARAAATRTRRVLEVTPVRPTLSIGALRARIVKQLGLERFSIDVVICKRGDATRRQIRGDVLLRAFLVEE